MKKNEIKSKLGEGWIQSVSIIEMVGKPKEYLFQTLEKYIDLLEKNENIIVLEKHIETPEKKEGELYGTFAEIEMLTKNASVLINFCFDYMPSSVEIIEPEKMHYKSQDFMDLVNDLQQRLHRVDMLLKRTKQQNKILTVNSNKLLFNLFSLAMGKDKKTIDEIARLVNFNHETVKKLLYGFIEKGVIKEENDKYFVIKPLKIPTKQKQNSKPKQKQKSSKKSSKKLSKKSKKSKSKNKK